MRRNRCLKIEMVTLKYDTEHLTYLATSRSILCKNKETGFCAQTFSVASSFAGKTIFALFKRERQPTDQQEEIVKIERLDPRGAQILEKD